MAFHKAIAKHINGIPLLHCAEGASLPVHLVLFAWFSVAYVTVYTLSWAGVLLTSDLIFYFLYERK